MIWHGTLSKPQSAAAVVRCCPSTMAKHPPATGATTTGEKDDQRKFSAILRMLRRPTSVTGR